MSKNVSLPELSNTQKLTKKISHLKKQASPSVRRLHAKKLSSNRNFDIIDSKALTDRFSKINPQMTFTKYPRGTFHRRSASQLSDHAAKENENLKKSLEFLNRRSNPLGIEQTHANDTARLLKSIKSELALMSNKLSMIVAKNDKLHLLSKLVPNDIEIEPRSARFYKIPCKDMEGPLRIQIMNSYDSDFVIYLKEKVTLSFIFVFLFKIY